MSRVTLLIFLSSKSLIYLVIGSSTLFIYPSSIAIPSNRAITLLFAEKDVCIELASYPVHNIHNNSIMF